MDGEGKSGLVLRSEIFSTPSFLGPERHLAGSHWEHRRRIFAGSELGMPHWGITGLSRRDIGAVARDILGELRNPGR